jgi:hypothetical protein
VCHEEESTNVKLKVDQKNITTSYEIGFSIIEETHSIVEQQVEKSLSLTMWGKKLTVIELN